MRKQGWDAEARWRHAFVATFPGTLNDERPMAEQAAMWAGVDRDHGDRPPGRVDGDRPDLEDSDDIYISLPKCCVAALPRG